MGKIFSSGHQYTKAIDIGERAYLMSKKMGTTTEIIESLLLKSCVGFLGKGNEALSYIKKAEKLLNTLISDESLDTSRIRAQLLLSKAITNFFVGDLGKATVVINKGIEMSKEIGNKLLTLIGLGYSGYILMLQGDSDSALENMMKCLKGSEELNNNYGIAASLSIIGNIYYFKGDINQALDFCKRSLATSSTINRIKIDTVTLLGNIYRFKGELNLALKYFRQGLELAEELSILDLVALNLNYIGIIFQMRGDFNQAVEYFERSKTISEKNNLPFSNSLSLFYLIRISLDFNQREKARMYLKDLKELENQTNYKLSSQSYMMAKALLLRTSKRAINHVEAQQMLKQVIDDETLMFEYHIMVLITLCDLLLEELNMYNNPEIIEEIDPLILRMLEISEDQHSYLYLAESKLLQAKLALIQLKIEEAKLLFTQAQNLAESYGFDLLAIRISGEHDILLEQIRIWDNMKEKNTPMSERIKLASLDSVLDRMQGKQAVEKSELVDEQSTILLILGEGGVLLFSYPFSNELKIDEVLFSSFLSAFSTFSNEFFMKGLDRAKFGEDMMLMESKGSFSFCYLFKGQTYLARQNLVKFVEEIQINSLIWRSLEQHYRTSQVLELKDNPLLENLIIKIFPK